MKHLLVSLVERALARQAESDREPELSQRAVDITRDYVDNCEDAAGLSYLVDVLMEEISELQRGPSPQAATALANEVLQCMAHPDGQLKKIEKQRFCQFAAVIFLSGGQIGDARAAIDKALHLLREAFGEPHPALEAGYRIAADVAAAEQRNEQSDEFLRRAAAAQAAPADGSKSTARLGGRYGTNTVDVNVLFCTSRRRLAAAGTMAVSVSAEFGSAGDNKPTYGRVTQRTRAYPEILADVDSLIARVETSWYFGDDRESSAQTIAYEIAASEADFWGKRLPPAASRERAQTIILYVHGFYNSFETALRGAAEVAAALGSTEAYLYSWPSMASAYRYRADRDRFAISFAFHLADFARHIAAGAPEATLVVVAHSMGSRYALSALSLLARLHPELSARLRLVLGSPDISEDLFQLEWEVVRGIISSCTLYRSSRDRALFLSGHINGTRRTGAGGLIKPAENVEVIETTRWRRGGIGHNDFIENAVDDLRGVAWFGLPAGKRATIAKSNGGFVIHDDKKGWTENVRAYMAAVVLMRKFKHDAAGKIAVMIDDQKGRIAAGGIPQDHHRLKFLEEVQARIASLSESLH